VGEAVSDNTRVMLDVGHMKFILPPEVKADSLRCLINAVQLDNVYISGKGHVLMPQVGDHIGISIVKTMSVEYFVDSRSKKDKNDTVVQHQDYDIIIDPLKEAIAGKEHAPIHVADYHIRIGADTFNYDNMAEPNFDPEAVIKQMIEAAFNKKNIVKV
jgi:hypothetical protein